MVSWRGDVTVIGQIGDGRCVVEAQFMNDMGRDVVVCEVLEGMGVHIGKLTIPWRMDDATQHLASWVRFGCM